MYLELCCDEAPGPFALVVRLYSEDQASWNLTIQDALTVLVEGFYNWVEETG
jgi:hypothetical protein